MLSSHGPVIRVCWVPAIDKYVGNDIYTFLSTAEYTGYSRLPTKSLSGPNAGATVARGPRRASLPFILDRAPGSTAVWNANNCILHAADRARRKLHFIFVVL